MISLDEIAKDLGIELVPVRIRDDLIDEDKKLKVLLAANFQRPKNSESKQRKVAVEYVRLCGYSANGDRATECQNGTRLTLNEIASQLGTSKRELQRALRIERNLTDSMKGVLNGNKYIKYFSDERYRRSNFYFSNFYFGNFIYSHFCEEQQKLKEMETYKHQEEKQL